MSFSIGNPKSSKRNNNTKNKKSKEVRSMASTAGSSTTGMIFMDGITDNNKRSNKSGYCHSKITVVWTSRVLFLLCFCTSAAILAWASYRLISASELTLAEDHFEAIADRALDEALEITLRKRLAAKSLATVASYTFPNAETWPLVSMYGFEAVASSIIDTASAETMGLCPLVVPNQLEEFETFAYDVAFPEINDYPNTTGLKDFNDSGVENQRGVVGFYSNLTKYKETDGSTDWNSPYKILCPFIMHSAGPRILMMNLHSLERFGSVIDELITCTKTTHHKNNNTRMETENGPNADTSYLNQCSILSDMMVMYDRNGTETGPAALIMQPIYPANNKDVLTGIITSTMEWVDVVGFLFNKEVRGVDVVLETETLSYTYRVENGEAFLKGQGSLHDTKYESYRRSIDLYSPGLFSYTSASYTLSIYPSQELFAIYGTRNPTIAMIGSLCIMLFTALLFFLYDYLVRQEFYKKQGIIEAKRKFVRFISHEVRTPLNTICMGSKLLQQDISKRLKQQTKSTQSTNINSTSTSTSLSMTTTSVPLPPRQNDNNNNNNQDDNQMLPLLQPDKLRDWTDLVSDILDNANTAVNVLSDLLNYDKVESGTLHMELSIVQVWSLIKRTADEFRVAAFAKQIQYVVDFSPLLGTLGSSGNTGSGRLRRNGSKAISKRNSNTTTAAAAGTTGVGGGGGYKGMIGSSRIHIGSSLQELSGEILEHKVIGDAVRISQVLRNFISNAIKFTPQNGEVTIRVSWQRLSRAAKKEFVLDRGDVVSFSQSGFVQVDVIDSGTGLSEEELKEMFGEGVQFNANRLQPGQGSGLGLYISKGIAEQHGGRLIVASEGVGHGTTFSLVLPLFHVPESEVPEKLKQRLEHFTVSNLGETNKDDSDDSNSIESFRILVADDSQVNRKLLVRLLVGRGHVCDEAENGLVAVEMVEKAIKEGYPYDTVLMDYEMPVMKGPESAKKMRSFGCSSFIVGVTGNLLPEDVNYFKQHGADCVLPKPLNLSDLEGRWIEQGIAGSSFDHRSNAAPPQILSKSDVDMSAVDMSAVDMSALYEMEA